MAKRDVSVLLLYTPEGRILLQHRTPDAFSLPNYWAFFGGGIEQGESPSQALERELLEELSYHVRDANHLMTQTFRYGQDQSMKYVFVEPYQDEPLVLGEGQAMGWFFPDETHALQMVDHDRAVIKLIQEYLNQL